MFHGLLLLNSKVASVAAATVIFVRAIYGFCVAGVLILHFCGLNLFFPACGHLNFMYKCRCPEEQIFLHGQ